MSKSIRRDVTASIGENDEVQVLGMSQCKPVLIDEAANDIVLDLDFEGLAAQEDVAWIDDQYNLGALKAYRGEYIAVVGKQVLGHDKSLKALRNQVAGATGYSLSRIVTSFIDNPAR